jgi:hypothetical protein
MKRRPALDASPKEEVMSGWIGRCLGIGLILVMIGGAAAPAVRGHDEHGP